MKLVVLPFVLTLAHYSHCHLIPIVYQPLPVFQQQSVPYNRVSGPFQPVVPNNGIKTVGGGCPMSPYATYLSEDQQQTVHELITEARGQGADEATVKQHVNKYLQEVLPPQKYSDFQEAKRQFEVHRISKRHAEEKQQPQKIFDLLDQYNGENDNMYAKFYEEYNAKKIRQFNNL